MKLYHMQDSGNCYKVRLLLHHLDRQFGLVPVNILQGESRTTEFLSKNPNGRVPFLELDDGRILAESNAILFYLADNSQYLPDDHWQRAQVLQWMFFEQYSHEPYIATSRFWISLLRQPERFADELAAKRPGGYAALDVMENHLSQREFMVGNSYSIADIALYAYTHVADEGGFELDRYGAISDWLRRVREQPRHIPIGQ